MDLGDRPILVAPDSFKGTMAATTVAAAIGRGLARAGRRADLAPVADGGEGTMDVLLDALGGELVAVVAHDALGREIEARFALLGDGRTAVVEVAAASGLTLIAEAKRDAEAASSAGTGELMAAAVACGARQILVAAGGSATTDGGRGAIEAVGDLSGAKLTVLCDV
ncbi:MAG TPA: glycerate kinase, partial [Polyangiaceae bacterium]